MAKILSANNLEQGWCSSLRMNYFTFMVLVDIKAEVAADPRAFRKDVVSAEKKLL